MPSKEPEVISAELRAHGLRVTPQRRAILFAFTSPDEHLGADEVLGRARRALPEVSRATVYNTLSELVQVGVLQAFGSHEPVRYERHAGRPHQHFRCLACSILFNVRPRGQEQLDLSEEGFSIERAAIVLEGTCPDCSQLEAALIEASTQPIVQAFPAAQLRERVPLSLFYAYLDSPLGGLFAAATERGLVMLAFEDGDEDQHLGRLARRLGIEPRKSADRFADVSRQIGEYFARRRRSFNFPVDWEVVDDAPRRVLDVVTRVRYGKVVNYRELWLRMQAHGIGPRQTGASVGSNPIALVVPCHRVLRADGRVGGYVGGIDRKRELLSLEGINTR
jgi:methylated-DNA-[protein]-cysteine S-methyltransferase